MITDDHKTGSNMATSAGETSSSGFADEGPRAKKRKANDDDSETEARDSGSRDREKSQGHLRQKSQGMNAATGGLGGAGVAGAGAGAISTASASGNHQQRQEMIIDSVPFVTGSTAPSKSSSLANSHNSSYQDVRTPLYAGSGLVAINSGGTVTANTSRAHSPITASTSAFSSRAATPGSSDATASFDRASLHDGQVIPPGSSWMNFNRNDMDTQMPVIERVIPGQGSIRGGIEVTILGTGFVNGLVVRFGDNKSPSTQCWNSTTLITHLPPAQTEGPVNVTFDGWIGGAENKLFRYFDDTDRQLIELALQVVGLKMNGKLEDAREIAKRIIGSGVGISNELREQLSGGNESGGGSSNHSAGFLTLRGEKLQQMLISCLDFVKTIDDCSKFATNWDVCNSEEQTMLHLASSRGYTRLCSALIEAGAALDYGDSNMYTALHFAVFHGREDIVRLLLNEGADPCIRTNDGSTVLDLASRELRDVLIDEYIDSEWDMSSHEGSVSDENSFEEDDELTDVSEDEVSGRDLSEQESELDIEWDDDYMRPGIYGSAPVSSRRSSRISSRRPSISESNDVASVRGENSPRGLAHYWADLRDNARNGFLRRRHADEEPQHGQHQQHRHSHQQQQAAAAAAFWNFFVPERLMSHVHTPTEDNVPPPSYEEIFPEGATSSESYQRAAFDGDKQVESTTDEAAEHIELGSLPDTETIDDTVEFPTSAEEEEDRVLQAWREKQRGLRNDKMFFFFWLPLFIFMLVWLSLKAITFIDKTDFTYIKHQTKSIVQLGTNRYLLALQGQQQRQPEGLLPQQV
ncbi:Mga2p [Sugiyamaella lignohabitans]|uniref:Mga2p n=1 Tax=Sugiyamaella lignohabitans TaxID=796027 RepID=A0A167F7C4_9ASCO|nr:Mga2p [Sugiyamaella lignohabitans]ANB14903.1 Mga2p [Sugiyamaella lignohabitans]